MTDENLTLFPTLWDDPPAPAAGADEADRDDPADVVPPEPPDPIPPDPPEAAPPPVPPDAAPAEPQQPADKAGGADRADAAEVAPSDRSGLAEVVAHQASAPAKASDVPRPPAPAPAKALPPESPQPADRANGADSPPEPPVPPEPAEAADESALPEVSESVGAAGPARVDGPVRPEWPALVGGPEALAQLEAAVTAPVHAYLILGAPGSDKRAVARVFAAELLAAAAAEHTLATAPAAPAPLDVPAPPDTPGVSDGRETAAEHPTDAPNPAAAAPAAVAFGAGAAAHRDRALREVHPDVLVVEPAGRALLAEEAAAIISEAARRPVEGTRKVIICDRFHTASPGVAASLLKTIEEPPAATIIVLLADYVPPAHVTIASRCVTVRLRPPPLDELQDWLEAAGARPEVAAQVARAAAGDPERARSLLADDGLMRRFEAWRTVPDRLDGTGARAAALVDEVRDLIDAAEQALSAAASATASSDPGDRAAEQRQRRQRRRLRDAELRFGFAVLADRYRQCLVPPSVTSEAADAHRSIPTDTPPSVTSEAAGEAIDRLRSAGEALVRNPNEKLLLQDLFCRLAPPA